MGRLSDEHKLTARTAPAVVEGVKLLLLKLGREALRYRARKVGIEGLVGAVMLEFLELPYERQLAILGKRLPQVEAMLGESLPAASNGQRPPAVQSQQVDVDTGRVVPPKTRNRRSG